jgi:hypothetical protein
MFLLIKLWVCLEIFVVCLKSLALRKWQGHPGCYFCGMAENCDHLLFECPIAKVIWGVITICFQPFSYEYFWIWITKALPREVIKYLTFSTSILTTCLIQNMKT